MRRSIRILVVSAMCAVPMGYVYFSTVLPNAAFPTFVRVSLLVPILTAAGIGYLAGVALDRIDETVMAALCSSLFGVLVMMALLAYPLTQPGIDSGSMGDLIMSVIRKAFPIILVCFMVLFVASFLGQYTSDEPGDKHMFDSERDKGEKPDG
jgi:hypothetical protein